VIVRNHTNHSIEINGVVVAPDDWVVLCGNLHVSSFGTEYEFHTNPGDDIVIVMRGDGLATSRH